MKEVCTVEGKVWSINDRPLCTHGRYDEPDFNYSYLFYDPNTGEVWGKRAMIEGRTSWATKDRERGSMDLTFWVENFEDEVPLGLLCALIVAAGEKLIASNGGLITASNRPARSNEELKRIVAGCCIKL